MRSVARNVLLLLVTPLLTRAEVRLPHMLSSHMVLQRDMPIHLWGWSNPGEQVTASMNGATATGTGDRLGKWSIFLPPLKAGGPYQIRIASNDSSQRSSGAHLPAEITLEDVLIG